MSLECKPNADERTRYAVMATVTKRSTLYRNGCWTVPDGNTLISVINPASEEPIATVPSGSVSDVDHAVAAAVRAFDSWRQTPAHQRRDVLTRILSGLQARAEEIAATITAEVGMPIKLSRRIQAGLPITVTESIRDLLDTFSFEDTLGNSRIIKEPVGVVACITPWNYPLHQVIAKVVPAIAAGCTVVLKPSEVAPLSSFILAEIIHDAGVPAGVFNLVTGYGDVVGEALVSHPDVDMISFTGSLRAGSRVAELAAGTVKKTSLELGGKSAAIVLDDADLTAAVKSTVASCFLNSGQTCNALTRLLVPEEMYDRVVLMSIEAASTCQPGDPTSDLTRIGPVVSQAQRDRVLQFIRMGIDEGAELIVGGTAAELGKGYYVTPTVFGRVTPEMTIAREEIFGPVLSILTYRDEDDAVRIAESTPYGLAAAVWSRDVGRAEKVARRLRSGQVDINGGTFNPLAPFGGCKQSGYGRELGTYGLEEFLMLKSLQYRA